MNIDNFKKLQKRLREGETLHILCDKVWHRILKLRKNKKVFGCITKTSTIDLKDLPFKYIKGKYGQEISYNEALAEYNEAVYDLEFKKNQLIELCKDDIKGVHKIPKYAAKTLFYLTGHIK